MYKRKICLLLAIGFAFGLFFGSAIGYVIGGKDGVEQAVEKMEESKVYEECLSKETSEVDITMYPTIPIIEKTQKNLKYKPFFDVVDGFDKLKEDDFKPLTKIMYKITTQYEDENGTIFQSTRVVDKDTYDLIKEGDKVYFDEDNNAEIYEK